MMASRKRPLPGGTPCPRKKNKTVINLDSDPESDLEVMEGGPACSLSSSSSSRDVEVMTKFQHDRFLQDEEYQHALQQDRARKEAVERAVAQKAQREERELQKLQSLSVSLPPEPAPAPSATMLEFRLPCGEKFTRRFNNTDTIGLVRTFVESQRLKFRVPASFELVASFPKRMLHDNAPTLAAAGLASSCGNTLFVTALD
eukprot:CAMPEP_0177652888 /NCGR_PEP_ID=MMETSP0447-20121125/13409_1 /TAXON_ID=0 /ORGANISM="Stygamoeba regulata, Strain BSH-02190019" /LENGTH=200 /DNA_ID=CAMNT_0019156241 /DNA_START=195 /DNA_END=798 /DNA_ORIENTATION=-